MSPFAKRSLLWVVVPFLLFVFFSATRLGVAELFSISARNEINSWGKISREPTTAEFESVESRLRWAIGLADLNPSNHENVARLNLVRGTTAGIVPELKKYYLRVGIAEIHVALDLRPISPYSWVILSALKHELHEYDDEFRYSLHRAVELGPWEPSVIFSLVEIGLNVWDVLAPEEQELIRQVYIRGLERYGKQMSDIAAKHLDAVCAEKPEQCE